MKFHADKGARSEIVTALSLIAQIGLSMVITILAALFLGNFIDSKAGTSPLFLLLMLLIGIGGAIKGMFTLTERFYKTKKAAGINGTVNKEIERLKAEIIKAEINKTEIISTENDKIEKK